MKLLPFLLFFVALAFPCAAAEDDPSSTFYADIERAQAKYRASHSELIRKADRVVVYLVDFEITKNNDPFGSPLAGDDGAIRVSASSGVAKILATKEVPQNHRGKLLNALAAQIAKPEHSGGAFCHFPIHGIRVYRDEELIHEGTFCWLCGNFSFSYPDGSSWLDSSKELEKIFTELLPIPEKELERFYEKYPGAKPKGEQGEQGGAGNPAKPGA